MEQSHNTEDHNDRNQLENNMHASVLSPRAAQEPVGWSLNTPSTPITVTPQVESSEADTSMHQTLVSVATQFHVDQLEVPGDASKMNRPSALTIMPDGEGPSRDSRSGELGFSSNLSTNAVFGSCLSEQASSFVGKPVDPSQTPDNNVSVLDTVGGHANLGGVYTMICIEDEEHGPIVLKPISKDGTGPTVLGKAEVEFYKSIQNHPFNEFCPKFYGTRQREACGFNLDYIIMQNVLSGLSKPSICDFKMGRHSYSPSAKQDKKDREDKKYPYMKDIGFRFTGCKIYHADSDEFKKIEREWSFSLELSHYPEALKTLFPTSQIRKLYVPVFKKRLQALEECLKNNATYRIYSSSILIVFEGDPELMSPEKFHCYAIDFAHCEEIKDGGIDDNYLFGIGNLIKWCDDLLAEE